MTNMAAYGLHVESFDHVINNISHIWTYRPDTMEITTFIDTVDQMVRYETVEVLEENCWYASAVTDGLFFTRRPIVNDVRKMIVLKPSIVLEKKRSYSCCGAYSCYGQLLLSF